MGVVKRKRAAREVASVPTTPGPREGCAEVVLDEIVDDPELGTELPVRAAAGWYRYGRTFYQVGQGPFPGWGFPEPPRPPATHQGLLF